MKKRNVLRKVLSLSLAALMCVSIPMTVLAETVTETKTTENGGLITVETTTTTTNADGNPSVVIEIAESTTGTNSEGASVEREQTTTTTITTGQNTTTTSTVVDGKETVTETVPVENVTVEVPKSTEDGENQNSAPAGDPVGTTEVTGDEKNGDDDTNYNYTTSTVEKQGSVTVTTTDVAITEKIDTENTDLEHVKSETNPDANNDLVYAGDCAAEEYLPGYTGDPVIPEGAEGYDYTYAGSGNTSKFVPAIVFTDPLTPEGKLEKFGEGAYIGSSYRSYYVGQLKQETRDRIAYDENGNYVTDENGFILDVDGNRIMKEERTTVGPDGETLYMHRFDNFGSSFNVEGWFEDGEWVKEMNGSDKYATVWAGPQQFILVDSKGNVVTTYCADNATPAQDAYGYNVENLEDATYYSDEDAKQIRSIALNGYWGTEEGFGSLEAMKAQLLASGKFDEAELESLNDGVALTATQMAIWSCSNKMSGIQFVNSFYSNWGVGDVPAEKTDEVELMFKIYDHLINQAPTDVSNTTADTIINADNFVGDMSVTVLGKAESHENNNDNDTTNDAYVTNLTFALVVTPSTENGDNLVVSVVDADGNVLARGRIAGEAQEGELLLTPDAEGNYSFNNIIMIEGEQSFKLNLEGIQNLKEGVYLYSSEVKDGTSSQTMVGVASGERGVNVTMDIKFEVDVEEGIVVNERVWHSESERTNRTPVPTTPPTPTPTEPTPTDPTEPDPTYPVMLLNDDGEVIEEEPVPLAEGPASEDELTEIPDEEVPLADVPETGDISLVWAAMSLFSAGGVVLLNKKPSKKER